MCEEKKRKAMDSGKTLQKYANKIDQLEVAFEKYGRYWTEMARKREAEIERLTAALKKYGQHKTKCEVNRMGNTCTCGLDAALRGWESVMEVMKGGR